MNEALMKRSYKKYIQRLDEMELILRFLTDEISRLPGASITCTGIDTFLENDVYQLDKVEESLKKLYVQFLKFRDNNADLTKGKNAAIEERAVAEAALRSHNPTSARAAVAPLPDTDDAVTPGGGPEPLLGFSSLAGAISHLEKDRFARTLFRATRGNAYTHFDQMDSEVTDAQGRPAGRSVFVTYYQGTATSALFEKINKICIAFGASIYAWPRTYDEADRRVKSLSGIIADKLRALEAYEEYFLSQIYDLLAVVRPGANSLIEEWRLFCLKEKALYGTLNLFQASDAALRADVWFPEAEENAIREILQSRSNASQVSAFLLADKHMIREMPPTYFRTTEFTSAFQGFVDTYGVPRYKEANPALITIVTLPFLFGIMYGDVGHGLGVLLFGSYLMWAWPRGLKNATDDTVLMIAGGRYMIFLMGIFATYAGLLYNDFLSLGMNFFGTRYRESHVDNGDVVYVPDTDKAFPYPFGFDPIWKGASNEMLFFNSFKMKFSVIVGGTHMAVGVIFKGLNALYNKDHLSFLFEFVPQILFLFGLVGWMDFLIFYKWGTDLSHPKPSIITTIINMFFFSGEDPFFSSQAAIQMGLVFLMLICVPMMLLPKPLLNKRMHERRQQDRLSGGHERLSGVDVESHGEDTEDDEEYNFGEEFIHQVIETIEFVLGVISNTASYLRLWALSLAHQQLALVFFNMTVLLVLKMQLPVVVQALMLFFVFQVFAAATFGVMFCMDSLECYLHALRLQWVEFQNKFYKADGHKFAPFDFTAALRGKS
eukprot:Polyplicarium_translucidae@DN3223_c1_g2_i1.p1